MTNTPARFANPLMANEESRPLKPCPTCGHATPAFNRCRNCFRDVTGIEKLSAADAQQYLAEQEVLAAERAAQEARERSRKQLIRRVSAVSYTLFIGWWIYATFIVSIPPLPGPTSNVRTVVSGPDVWAVEGGNLGGTRATSAATNMAGDVAWETVLSAAATTSLTASSDTLFATLDNSRIAAINAGDGSLLWETQLQNVPVAPPTVAGDRLYIGQRGGVVIALDAATGNEVFRADPLPGNFGSSPIVTDGVIYAFVTGTVAGIDAETGEHLWIREFKSFWSFVTPVIEGNVIALTTSAETLLFDRTTGEQTYFHPFRRAHPYAVAIEDRTVYAFSDRLGGALSIDSRPPWWEGTRGAWSWFNRWGMLPTIPVPASEWLVRTPEGGYAPAFATDHLMLATEGGELRALSRSVGAQLWSRDDLGDVSSAPTMTAGGLLVTRSADLLLIDPIDGVTLQTLPLPGGLKHSTVTAHGTYITTSDGSVIAVR
ncbi:MAG TPA: PQQ-binding-like beta-propeller repeat protein [Dehalococcoidia bacterium]|nr:PQQ-binding-like beta-propeller repeat protein [Dehalococcoidia bacterium]